MGQFFILLSRKFVNWNSPVFFKRYFFICSTYTSNKCFFIISNNFKKKIKPWSTIFYTPFYKWMPRSKSGASKSRPRWVAHTCIGNVWEYPPPPSPRVKRSWFMICDSRISIRSVCCCISRFVICDRNYHWRQRKMQLCSPEFACLILKSAEIHEPQN